MTKEYLYLSSDVQKQLREIKRKVYLKMNGVTVEQMENSGVLYSKNYGVSFPEIKQLAGAYPQSGVLARALWHENIRETMLMATLLCPENECDVILAEEWSGGVTTLELAENLSRNLLCRLSFMREKTVEWVSSGDRWKCAIGFFCAAYGLDNLSKEQVQSILDSVKSNKCIGEVAVYRAVALFLRKRGALDLKAAKNILSFVGSFENSPLRAERYIFEEVQTDLRYRFEL